MRKLVFALGLFSNIFITNAQFINLNKNVYKPEEKIIVTFSSESDLPSDAWIGILPAWVSHGSEAVNDKYDITYQYLKNGTRGTYIFTAPKKEGKYDFRLNDSDKNGNEIAMTYFEVSSIARPVSVPKKTNIPNSSVSSKYLILSQTQFKPGESISLHFTAPSSFADNAWVGIIPSSIAHGSEAKNDKYDLAYQYLKKRTGGTLIFKAPTKTGNYDFRMHDTDNNGKEVSSISFIVSPVPEKSVHTVSDIPNSSVSSKYLTLSRSQFKPGESISLHFTAPSSFADNAWVGIIPSSIAHGSEAKNDKYDLAYQYLKKRTGGTLIFKAPTKTGNYDFRMHDTDNNGKEVSSISFIVSNSN